MSWLHRSQLFALTSLLFVQKASAAYCPSELDTCCAYGTCYIPMNLTNAVLTAVDAEGGGYDVDSDCDGGSVHSALLDDDPNTCCHWVEADTDRVDMTLTLADEDVDVFTLAIIYITWQYNHYGGPNAVPVHMYDPVEDRSTLVEMKGDPSDKWQTTNDFFQNYTWYGSELTISPKGKGVETSSWQVCELIVLFIEASLPTTTALPTTTTTTPTTTIITTEEVEDGCTDVYVDQSCCLQHNGSSVVDTHYDVNTEAYIPDADFAEDCFVSFLNLPPCNDKQLYQITECDGGGSCDGCIGYSDVPVCHKQFYADLYSDLNFTDWNYTKITNWSLITHPFYNHAKCNLTLNVCAIKDAILCAADGSEPYDDRICSLDTAFAGNVSNVFSVSETFTDASDCVCDYHIDYCVPDIVDDADNCTVVQIFDCCDDSSLVYDTDDGGELPSNWYCADLSDQCPADRWFGEVFIDDVSKVFNWWFDSDLGAAQSYCKCTYVWDNCTFPTPLPTGITTVTTIPPTTTNNESAETTQDKDDDDDDSNPLIPGLSKEVSYIAVILTSVVFLALCCGMCLKWNDKRERKKRDKRRQEIKRKKAQRLKAAAKTDAMPSRRAYAAGSVVREAPIQKAAEPVYQMDGYRTAPHETAVAAPAVVAPRGMGPRAVGPRAAGPRAAGPRAAGPRAAVPTQQQFVNPTQQYYAQQQEHTDGDVETQYTDHYTDDYYDEDEFAHDENLQL